MHSLCVLRRALIGSIHGQDFGSQSNELLNMNYKNHVSILFHAIPPKSLIKEKLPCQIVVFLLQQTMHCQLYDLAVFAALLLYSIYN